MLKPDILPPVKNLLSRIIACVGTSQGGLGWGWGCQRLKVLSLSYPAHQSHQSAAHINIDAMHNYQKKYQKMHKYKYAKYLQDLASFSFYNIIRLTSNLFALFMCILTAFPFLSQWYFLKSVKSAPQLPHQSASHINICMSDESNTG